MRVLGCDYGLRRMGLAVSDPEGILSVPLRTVAVRDDEDAAARVREAVEETDAEVVVVGLPINMDGTVGPMARRVLAFVERLRRLLAVRIETCDERLSTWSAERALLDADLSRAKRKQVRDKMAAQIILQGYLDGLVAVSARAAGEAEPS